MNQKLLCEIPLHFYDFENWFNGFWSVAKSKVRGFRSPQIRIQNDCAPGKFRTLIFSRNPHCIASNLAGIENCILFISLSGCRVFLPQIREPAQLSLCLLVCPQPDSRPAESTLHTPINKTSSMILHSDQISYPKRNPRRIIITFSSNVVISCSIYLISADVATSTWHDAGGRFTKSIFGDTNLLLLLQQSRKPIVVRKPGNIRFSQPPGFTF